MLSQWHRWSMLSGFFSTTLSSMGFSFLAMYLGTLVMILSCYHPARANEAYGEYTIKQLRMMDQSTLHVAYLTFCKLWKALLPSLIIMKPMTDLCWTCQQNSSAIFRASNFPDRVKSDVLKKAEEHLLLVQKERSFYKTKCHLQTQGTSSRITRSTMRSKFTILRTLFNLGQFTSWYPGSAVCLGYVARRFLVR